MPELPEVETTTRGLSDSVIGYRVLDIWTDTPSRLGVFSSRDIKGEKIESVKRRGKNIIINLKNDLSLLIHQKISGHLLVGKWEFIEGFWKSKDDVLQEKINSYIHFVITLSRGKMIALSDPRKFAKIEIWNNEDLKEKMDREIGPDAMEITMKEFKERLSVRKSIIKKVLLNQKVVSGIGNIYSDEILWESRINPYRYPSELSNEEYNLLFKSMKKVLNKAISLKGDSMSDYRLIDGTRGGYQNEHKVYGREGLPCFRKDGGEIERKKMGGRSLRFCPICQI